VEEMVDVSADLLEETSAQLDAVSKVVFRKTNLKRRHPTRSNNRLHNTLVDVGNIGERLSRVRDSLLGLQRIVPFVTEPKRDWISSVMQTRLESAKRDLLSLIDYETHLYTKVQFLLDAILGFINTKQNDIIYRTNYRVSCWNTADAGRQHLWNEFQEYARAGLGMGLSVWPWVNSIEYYCAYRLV
jgi:magnesium transporter